MTTERNISTALLLNIRKWQRRGAKLLTADARSKPLSDAGVPNRFGGTSAAETFDSFIFHGNLYRRKSPWPSSLRRVEIARSLSHSVTTNINKSPILAAVPFGSGS